MNVSATFLHYVRGATIRLLASLIVFVATFAFYAQPALADDNFVPVITSTPSEPTVDTTPTFQFTTTFDTQVFTYRCYIDNLSIGDCTSPFTVAPLESGSHTFSVGLVDSFGNFSPVDSHTWTINTLSQGDGSEAYPFGVTDCEGLQDIDLNLSAYYRILNNIDCTGTVFTPIGSDATPFTGHLNGNGFAVSNVSITIDQLQSTGLFATTENGSVTAFRLQDSTIVNNYSTGNYSTGGIIGLATDTALEDVTTDNVTVAPANNGSTGYTGGLVGAAIGSTAVSKSYFSGAVAGLNNGTGGIAGALSDTSTVDDSYSDASITGAGNVAGLAGVMIGTSYIRTSYSAATILSDGDNVGGIVGNLDTGSTVTDSFSYSDLTGVTAVGRQGAVVGANTGTITNVVYDATRAGQNNCIGLAGGSVSNCNSTTDDGYFKGNSTNPPLNVWSLGSPWNLHEQGQLPSFAIGRVACDNPVTQGESSLRFGCEWARESKHHYSGNKVSQQVRYRVQGSGDTWRYQDWPNYTVKVLITGLQPSTQYEIQFHAVWEIGTSDWEPDTALLTTGADSNLDTDGDGIKDSVELTGPNMGDANGDHDNAEGYFGGDDFQQANVTSFINPITGNYAVLESDCTANSGVSIAGESSGTRDVAYDYTLGLMSFSATGCGATATFTQYFYGSYDPATFVARKFNPTTGSYSLIPGTVLSSVVINGQAALKITYQIVDNGPLDQNPTVGTITDPSGPASLQLGVPNTGLGNKHKQNAE